MFANRSRRIRQAVLGGTSPAPLLDWDSGIWIIFHFLVGRGGRRSHEVLADTF